MAAVKCFPRFVFLIRFEVKIHPNLTFFEVVALYRDLPERENQ